MPVRPVSDQDFQTIADIYNVYVDTTVITFEEEPISVQEVGLRVGHIKKLNLPWWVAENESQQVVGFAYAGQFKSRTAYRFSVELTIYIAPDWTSQGWGKKLYGALLNQLRQTPIRSVIAGITLPNPASVKVHEKFGMKKVAHFKNVGFKFGKWLDVGYWQSDVAELKGFE